MWVPSRFVFHVNVNRIRQQGVKDLFFQLEVERDERSMGEVSGSNAEGTKEDIACVRCNHQLLSLWPVLPLHPCYLMASFPWNSGDTGSKESFDEGLASVSSSKAT